MKRRSPWLTFAACALVGGTTLARPETNPGKTSNLPSISGAALTAEAELEKRGLLPGKADHDLTNTLQNPPMLAFQRSRIRKNKQQTTNNTIIMALKVRPLADRVLVRPIEAAETKKGGIIIPDTAKEKPQEGEVVALGTGKRDDDGKIIDFTVKKGDKVLISKVRRDRNQNRRPAVSDHA
jgi:chaperonin GroES